MHVYLNINGIESREILVYDNAMKYRDSVHRLVDEKSLYFGEPSTFARERERAREVCTSQAKS